MYKLIQDFGGPYTCYRIYKEYDDGNTLCITNICVVYNAQDATRILEMLNKDS